MTILMLLLGLCALLAGGTALVTGASALATRVGVSPLVVGLTVVAFGTSAPELVVNILGALRGETALAVGNVIGSNLANLGLVLGVAGLLRPVTIQSQLVRRELPLLMLVTCILVVMTLDRVLLQAEPRLSRSDGVILLLLFSIFAYITVSDFLSSRAESDSLFANVLEMEENLPARRVDRQSMDWLLVAGGIAGLALGGHLTIVHGSTLAEILGVSPTLIGLLVVAIGTSMPELVTSVIAALRNEADLCVGNVIGSNIFNSLVVLPASALVRPLPIPDGILLDIVISLVLAAMLIPIFLLRRARMSRRTAFIDLALYVGYMTWRAGF